MRPRSSGALEVDHGSSVNCRRELLVERCVVRRARVHERFEATRIGCRAVNVALAAMIALGQLVVPIVLLVLVLRTSRDRPRATGVGAQPNAVEESEPLTALRCPGCGAPVPLLGDVFACPHCAREVRPPDAYRRVLSLRARSREELARAERIWLRSRITASPLLLWPARAAVVATFVAVVRAGSALQRARWPEGIYIASSIVGFLQVVVLLITIQVFGALRRTTPPVPEHRALPPALDTCRRCGAPVAFEADAFSTACAYCGADNYRGALAVRASVEARARHDHVTQTLLEAIREWRERESSIELAAILLGIVSIVAAVGAILSAASDAF